MQAHTADAVVHVTTQQHATPDDEANATVSLSNVKALEDHPVKAAKSKEGQTTAATLAAGIKQQSSDAGGSQRLPNTLPRSTQPGKTAADATADQQSQSESRPLDKQGLGRGQKAPGAQQGKRKGVTKMRGQGQMETGPDAIQRLQQACTRNTGLTMLQVKQCLEAAARGKGYAEGHAGEQQLQAGEQDAAQQLQERLRSQSEAQMQEGQQTVSSARQLREGREAAHSSRTRPPDLIQRSVIASFMASGGDLGLMLIAAVGLLWWCLIRQRGKRASKRSQRMD